VIARRLSALSVALLVAGASPGPCAAAAIARAGDAALAQDSQASHTDAGHAGHADEARTASGAHGTGNCHGPTTSIVPQCPCGCSGNAPHAAASTFSAPWALPAPVLPRLEEGNVPAAPGRHARPLPPLPHGIDHVPIAG
jgi:hypothetical protein